MLSVVRQAPERFGHEQARWTLSARRRSLPWLRVNSEAALLQVLRRLHIVRKRGQAPVHSPDPLYADKVAYHHHCRQQVQLDPERRVLVYLDEVGYERQPTLACDFEQRGKHVPLARLSTAANVVCRGVGALNALTGHVLYHQPARITTAHLKQFYAHLVDTYPHAVLRCGRALCQGRGRPGHPCHRD